MNDTAYDTHGAVAVITLDNPPMNNFSYAVRAHVVGATERAEADPAIKATPAAKLELYDVVKDPHEDRNVAAANPAVVVKVEEYLKTARTESRTWPLKEPVKK